MTQEEFQKHLEATGDAELIALVRAMADKLDLYQVSQTDLERATADAAIAAKNFDAAENAYRNALVAHEEAQRALEILRGKAVVPADAAAVEVLVLER